MAVVPVLVVAVTARTATVTAIHPPVHAASLGAPTILTVPMRTQAVVRLGTLALTWPWTAVMQARAGVLPGRPNLPTAARLVPSALLVARPPTALTIAVLVVPLPLDGPKALIVALRLP